MFLDKFSCMFPFRLQFWFSFVKCWNTADRFLLFAVVIWVLSHFFYLSLVFSPHHTPLSAPFQHLFLIQFLCMFPAVCVFLAYIFINRLHLSISFLWIFNKNNRGTFNLRSKSALHCQRWVQTKDILALTPPRFMRFAHHNTNHNCRSGGEGPSKPSKRLILLNCEVVGTKTCTLTWLPCDCWLYEGIRLYMYCPYAAWMLQTRSSINSVITKVM